ncbi:sensor domain-containing diguanylate cyclase [Sphingomonas endolithica]|uniref:GGDEF domain-containing protein n=1 Tax=Sphingomonas endolithica TaxID=2972485 RepID=UPI0021AEEF9D|nr:diguanylate cyclase [Sphingomonas sp. ZFBP2030]
MLSPRCLAFIGLFIAAITLMPGVAQAKAGTIGERLAVCVRRDAPGLSAGKMLAAPVGFDCRTPQRHFGPGDYWVVSRALDVELQDVRRTVRVCSVWQQRMTLYARFADGTTLRIPVDQHAATRNLQLGAIIQLYLPQHPAKLQRLLWHVQGSANVRGIILAPRVATAIEAASSNMVMAAIYAGFAGVCAALLLYNFALARALQHAFLRYYCLMMVGMLLYTLSSSGALAWLLPGIENNLRLRINYVVLAATGIAALFFLRHFFEEGVIPRALDRVILLACGVMLVPTLLVATVAPWQMQVLDRAYSLAFMALIMMSVPMIVCAWRKRSQFLSMFAIAWATPVILATARAAHGLGLLSYSFWLDNSTILSMALEALLSSLAIAYRILLITRERDAAREQEVVARMLADADPLTGLMNRRSFLRDAIGRVGDQQLLLVDLDNFKRVNDTIGHDGGDDVLRVVARCLRGAAPNALVARIGGEEFAIVSAAGGALDAKDVLAQLRTAHMPFDLTVTASVGACIGPLAREADWKAMYCAADRALFEAKAAGRDRVRQAIPSIFAVPVAA